MVVITSTSVVVRKAMPGREQLSHSGLQQISRCRKDFSIYPSTEDPQRQWGYRLTNSRIPEKAVSGPLAVTGNTDWNCPPWPGITVTICMSYFMTGDPDKEYATNKPPPTGRIQERSNGDRRHQSACPTNLPETFWLDSIVPEWCACHQKGPWVRMIGQRQPETNLITITPETANHKAERSSWVPSPSCFPPGRPFPVKFLAWSARVSPWTIHFQVLDKSPVWALEGKLPSCNTSRWPLFLMSCKPQPAKAAGFLRLLLLLVSLPRGPWYTSWLTEGDPVPRQHALHTACPWTWTGWTRALWSGSS